MAAARPDNVGRGNLRRVLVKQATWEADGVLSLTLVDPDGADLPAWRPGAHIDLVLASGLVRQYSLCGDPAAAAQYRIAVLREASGRGGSAELHDRPPVGQLLSISAPRNHFPLEPAARHLFLAGGIGITPLLPMIGELAGSGRPWILVYGGRTRAGMAFLRELTLLPGGHVTVLPEDEFGRLDLPAVLAAAEEDTAIYCCGPEGLLRAVEELTKASANPDRLRLERFGPAPELVAQSGPRLDDGSFEVELRRSDLTLTVPPDRTLLDVVLDARPDTLFSCGEGYCGSCETRVLEGIPDHRDTLLSKAEQDAGRVMMICVGRSKSPRLVLDL